MATKGKIVQFLKAEVFIDARPEGAKIDLSFTVTGTASCKALERRPGERDLRGEDATSSISVMRVPVGDDSLPLHDATLMGSGNTPSATWSCVVNTMLPGLQTITAFVSANRSGFVAGSDHKDRHVVIDITPPMLTINPPADVTSPTPPYTAIISGTLTDDATLPAVEWRLGDSGEFQTATTKMSWSTAAALPGLGGDSVAVRARDIAGTVSPAEQATVRVAYVTPQPLGIISSSEGDSFAAIEERRRIGI